MTDVDLLLDQIHRAYHAEPWHGSALRQLATGLTGRQAAAKPIPEAHSIWEIILHLTTWTEAAGARLAGEKVAPIEPELDWPKVKATSDAAWAAALERLDAAQARLEAEVGRLADKDLAGKAKGSSITRYEALQGLLQHDAYHAGQIALLRKAQEL